jgi:hypothetical protein
MSSESRPISSLDWGEVTARPFSSARETRRAPARGTHPKAPALSRARAPFEASTPTLGAPAPHPAAPDLERREAYGNSRQVGTQELAFVDVFRAADERQEHLLDQIVDGGVGTERAEQDAAHHAHVTVPDGGDGRPVSTPGRLDETTVGHPIGWKAGDLAESRLFGSWGRHHP